MNNKTRHSIFSARAGLPGRMRARLRVYTLGRGADAQLLFSLRLWQAATLHQEQQARLAL